MTQSLIDVHFIAIASYMFMSNFTQSFYIWLVLLFKKHYAMIFGAQIP